MIDDDDDPSVSNSNYVDDTVTTLSIWGNWFRSKDDGQRKVPATMDLGRRRDIAILNEVVSIVVTTSTISTPFPSIVYGDEGPYTYRWT